MPSSHKQPPSKRLDLLNDLAKRILALPVDRTLRVSVDGVDGAG